MGKGDVLRTGMLTPLVARVDVSKKFVIFSVFTGKTPEGVIPEAKLQSSAAAVKDMALMMDVSMR